MGFQEEDVEARDEQQSNESMCDYGIGVHVLPVPFPRNVLEDVLEQQELVWDEGANQLLDDAAMFDEVDLCEASSLPVWNHQKSALGGASLLDLDTQCSVRTDNKAQLPDEENRSQACLSNKRKRKHRNEKRMLERQSKEGSTSAKRMRLRVKAVRKNLVVHTVEPAAGAMSGTKPGWQGDHLISQLPKSYAGANTLPTLAELRETHGFEVYEFNGKGTMAFVSEDGGLLALVAGRNDDKDWVDNATEVHYLLKSKLQLLSASKSVSGKKCRRGSHKTFVQGVSMGLGRQHPGNIILGQSDKTMTAIKECFESPSLSRVAKYVDSIHSTVAPAAYKRTSSLIEGLGRKLEGLQPMPFTHSFAAGAINIAERVQCLPHKDAMNYAGAFCAIGAFGTYDYKTEGHMVLWDLKIAIEFPPGSIFFIPSSLLTHSNTRVTKGERISVTWFTAGGLFRYADCGFATVSSLSKTDKDAINFKSKERVEKALSYFREFASIFLNDHST